MPRLRCLIGPSPDKLVAIPVNSSEAHYISSDLFEGKVAVYVKLEPPVDGTNGHANGSPKQKFEVESESELASHEYFDRPERAGVTWSIQVKGRFLQSYTADDILFGNTFDRPLHLPWGSGAALKFMHYIDPTLEHDLYAQQPWALSPLITTMPYFKHRRISSAEDLNKCAFPEKESIKDDIIQLAEEDDNSVPESAQNSPKARQSRFANPATRRSVIFGPKDLITTDFCYGFIKFPSLLLSLPAGISFDLKRYWDGQPVRFVCCERPKSGSGSGAAGFSLEDAKTFWVVQFEIEEDGVRTPREESLEEDFERRSEDDEVD